MAKTNLKRVEQKNLIKLTALIMDLAKENSLESINYLTAMITSYAIQHGTEEAKARISDAPDLFLDVVRLKLAGTSSNLENF